MLNALRRIPLRRMPSVLPKPKSKSTPSWRTSRWHTTKGPPGPRTYSTTQTEGVVSDAVHPAIFNGPPNQANGRRQNAPSKDQASSRGFEPSQEPQPAASSLTFRNKHYQSKAHGRRGHGRAQRNAPIRAGKRKAEDDIEEPAARRVRRDEPDEPFLDEKYLRNTLGYPTREEYPSAPKGLFSDSFLNVFHNAVQGSLKLTTKSSTISRGQKGNPAYMCELSANVPTLGELAVKGNGVSKHNAQKAAYVHFIIKLHQAGLLKELFPNHEESLGKDVIKEEADAKTDIYNYAAQFGLIPTFHSRTVQRIFRARGNTLAEVEIELPEQNIKVAARGRSFLSAQIAACVKFKEAAEKWHSEHGEGEIVVQDAYALNVSNAQEFLELCKIEKVRFTLEFESQQENSSRHFTNNKAQAILDGEPAGPPVTMTSRKEAEAAAKLCAAIELSKQHPQLITKFREALAVTGGRGVLRPLPPLDFPIDQDAIIIMKDTMREVRKLGLPDIKEEILPEEDFETNRRMRSRQRLKADQVDARSEQLRIKQQNFENDPNLQQLRQKKRDLPMNQYRAQVLNVMDNSIYSIIVGATGSGKTTQVPQIILEEAISAGEGAKCNIICTQPRRIAATSVGRRVAEERNEPLQESVGYQVRFDARLPRHGGSITYCTSGILMQQLQHDPDDIMDNISHLLIDEVHERDIIVDFLLIILKKVMGGRERAGKKVPKVVLMSATLDTDLFAGYFKKASKGGIVHDCPMLSVPGRTFPVKERYYDSVVEEMRRAYSPNELAFLQNDKATVDYMRAENSFSIARPNRTAVNAADEASAEASAEETDAVIDWKGQRAVGVDGEIIVSNERDDALVPVNLVAATIAHVTKTSNEGAVLVFLPGLDDITKVDEYLRNRNPLGVDFKNADKFKLFMLHSSIPSTQTDVFNPVPEGCRKIILSTNIAETSVTIPDVQYVIDTGKLREKRYDQVRRITRLLCTWISKSNSKQRAGRAGRVQNGNYYALFSKARYESLRAIGLPEMLRSDLQEVCLDIKAQAFESPIREFLADAIEPPPPSAVDASVRNLIALQALTEDEHITQLGRLLASLPVHPSLGKMIVLGLIFRCLDPMIILGAAVTERALFVTPIDNKRGARLAHAAFVQGSDSDVVAVLNAFRELRSIREVHGQSAAFYFANSNFLHMGAFRTIKQTAEQIEEILVDSGLIPRTRQRYKYELGSAELNQNATNVALIKALALAGFHPNLAVNRRGILFRTPGENNAMMHPSSCNFKRRNDDSDHYERSQIFSYSTMSKSADGNSMYLRDSTGSSPLMAALFGGRLKMLANMITMDGWLPFYVKGEYGAAKTVMEFRKAFDRLMTNAYQDLSTRRAKDKSSFANDKGREVFAQGLVDVLDRDLKVKRKADVPSFAPRPDRENRYWRSG